MCKSGTIIRLDNMKHVAVQTICVVIDIMSTKLLRFPLSTFAPMYFDSKLLPIIHADLYCAFSQPFPNHGASMQIRHLDSSDESTRRRQQKRSPDRHRRRRPIAPLPRRGTRPCWPGRPRSPSGQLIRRSAAASAAQARPGPPNQSISSMLSASARR
jgi:hypothetical protein